MSTQDLYEQWEQRVAAKGKAEGKAEGLLRTLVATYETRFGPIPAALSSALAKVATPETTERWVGLFVTGSAEEIAAALRNGKSA